MNSCATSHTHAIYLKHKIFRTAPRLTYATSRSTVLRAQAQVGPRRASDLSCMQDQVPSNQQPVSSRQWAVSSTKQPATSTQYQVPSTQYPVSSIKYPVSSIQHPVSQMVIFGFLFLTIGIITGAVWANSAWGRCWGWDPQKTWRLIAWLIYTALLHLRMMRGWQGWRTAYFSIFGFLAVMFAYLGANYLPGLRSWFGIKEYRKEIDQNIIEIIRSS